MMIGSEILPYYNMFADLIAGQSQTDNAIWTGQGVYPGENHCRLYSPHALWHEESANLTMEFAFLADDINSSIFMN